MKYLKSVFCLLMILTLLCGCTASKTQETSAETTEEIATASTVSTTSAVSGETDASSTTGTTSENSETASASSASRKSDKTDVKTSVSVKTSKRSRKTGSVREIVNSMTLEEKVGQIFIVAPEALVGNDGNVGLNDGIGKDAVTSVSDDMKNAIAKYHVGGLVHFAQNITTPSQISSFNSSLQDASDIPLFISVDEEGGTVARLGRNSSFGLPTYRSAAAVGSSGNESDAYSMGSTIGSYLKKYGFNMDFAPVADVNSNPNNPVIGSRSFSSDPKIAAKMSNAAAKGLRSKGIIPTLKHFPGHGDTAEDSHQSLAVNYHSLDRLYFDDWLPYTSGNLNGCAVMVGHIALPNVTGEMKSAVLSKKIVTDYLRGEIGFDGLVITDSMKMQGVTNYYDTGTACIMALNAGCDILLMPQNFIKSYDAVLAAVKNGTVSEERLDESVYRIIKYKSDYGIIS